MTAQHRPSDLAAVAARSAVAGASAVRFDVAHLLPGVFPAPAGPVAPSGPPRSGERIREALAFEAAGLGFRVRTWTPEHPEEAPLGVAVTGNRPVVGPLGGDVTADLADPSGVPEGHEYVGHSAVNPSFLYDQTRATEILLTLSPGPWKPDLGDCRMVGLAVETLTAAAAQDAVAPILLLQSPVAPFREPSPSFRKDGSGEEPRIARATAIRMTVGLDENRPDRRLAMLRRVAAFARRTGIGLQLSDSRLGRPAGDWWTVLPPDPDAYLAEKARQAGAVDGVHPTEVRVATFVGPARVGSTAAIVAELVGRKVGVLALTSAALQEISFVHAVLPVAPVRTGRGRRPGPRVRHELGAGIGQLASDCGLAPRRRVPDGGRQHGVDLTPAVDYCVLESGPVPLAEVPGGGTDDGDRTSHPLWVSWTLPAGRPVPEPVAVVLEQVEKVPEVASAGVDFARVRRQPDGRSRGRAKLSVVLSGHFDDDTVPDVLSALCFTVQTASVAQCKQLGLDVGDVDLRVVWRERWIGAR